MKSKNTHTLIILSFLIIIFILSQIIVDNIYLNKELKLLYNYQSELEQAVNLLTN